MDGTVSYDDLSQSGVLLWPPRKFREDFAHSLSDFILDESRGLQSLGPDSISSDSCDNLVASITRFMSDYMLRVTPQWQERDYGVMFLRWQRSDEEPFTAVGASHTNNPIAYPHLDGLPAGDPREQIRRFHNGPEGFYSECNQDSLTARGGRIRRTLQSMEVLGPSDASTYTSDPPNACSGNRVVEAATTGSHSEPTTRRRNREAASLDENSSTITLESYRSKRVDTKKSEYRHVCKHCGERFQFPARLKSHMETASHTTRRYRCETCNQAFTRQSSLMRHQNGDTACKGARRTNGTSTLGSSLHASAGSPSRTPYNTQDGIPLSDSSADPIPGYRQRPPVPTFYSPSPTNSRTTSRRDYSPPIHVPSQPQDLRITQSSLSPRHKFIDPMMLGGAYRIADIGREFLT